MLLCLGPRIPLPPPQNHPSAWWERGVKPISGDGWRSFGCFPAQRCPWCLQARVKVRVKLENGFKNLCRRVVGRGPCANPRGLPPHPHLESQPPLGCTPWGQDETVGLLLSAPPRPHGQAGAGVQEMPRMGAGAADPRRRENAVSQGPATPCRPQRATTAWGRGLQPCLEIRGNGGKALKRSEQPENPRTLLQHTYVAPRKCPQPCGTLHR